MARRGLATALQAALAGAGGYAQGMIASEERKRRQTLEDEARKRQQINDLITFGERAITPGPLATRAPAAPAAPAGPTTAVPPSAVPLPTGRVDFTGAMQQLAQEERVPSGTTPITIGDQTLYIPIGQRARDIRASERLQEEESALQRAIASTRATEGIRQEFSAKEKDAANLALYNAAKSEYGLREKYDPSKNYATVIELREKRAQRAASMAITPYQQAQLDLDRRRMAIQEASLRQRQTDAEFRQSKLPASAQNKLAGYEAGVTMAADLRTQIEQNKDALGFKNVLWGQVVNRLDPQGVGVRAAIEALSGEIRNQRFGGALTANEAKFAERFLPSATDRADAALSKLTQLENYLEQKRKGIYTVYGGEYKSLRGESAADQLAALAGPPSAPSATTTAAPAAPAVGRDTTTARPDSVTARPDSVTVRPDTTIARPDSTTVRPDTTAVRPDSVVTAPATAPVSRNYAEQYAKLAEAFTQELRQATTDAQRGQARTRYNQAMMALGAEEAANRPVTYQDISPRQKTQAPAAPPAPSAPFDTMAIGRGMEVGMQTSAVRRPNYRPVLENPMFPEGINEYGGGLTPSAPAPRAVAARPDTLRRALEQVPAAPRIQIPPAAQVRPPRGFQADTGSTTPLQEALTRSRARPTFPNIIPAESIQLPSSLGMLDRQMATALLEQYQEAVDRLQSQRLTRRETESTVLTIRRLQNALQRFGVTF